MTVFPDGKVYIAFDDGPYTASPTYTDVTSYVRGFSTHRGRSSDFDQFDTGTAQIVLDNRARTFDPFYSIAATRTNLVSNPSFEVDTTGWSANRCTATRITTEQIFGSASIQLTVSAGETFCSVYTNPRVTITPSTTYRWSFYAKQISGASSGRATINWYTSGGTYISQSLGATTALAATWTRLNVSGTAPANAERAELIIEIPVTAATRTIAADGCLFEQTSTLGTYFDGGLDPYAYGTATTIGWTGTPNNSTSTRTASTARINIMPNPSFETNLTSSSGFNITNSRVAATWGFGSWAQQTVATATGTSGPFYSPVAVDGGLSYTFSAYGLHISGTARTYRMVVEWYNSAGGLISTSNGTSQAISATRQRWTLTATAPAAARTATVTIYSTTTGTVGDTAQWDGILFEQAAAVGDYFDGSTYATGTLGIGQSSWTGTANGSTSQILQFPRATQLTPRRPIKITGVANSVEYDVFRGFVAGWPVTWSEAGKDSTVTIQAFDALGLMANEQVPTDWADFYTRAQSPTVYFKGNDSQGTAIIRDAISNGAKYLANSNSATNPNFFEAPQLAPGALSQSVFCASYIGSDLTSTATPAGAIAGDYPIVSVSAWLKGTGPQSLGYNQIRVANNGGRVSIYYNASQIRLTFSRFGIAGTPNVDVNSNYVPSFGQPFHIFLIVNNSTTPTVYINGQLVTTTAAAGGAGSGGVWPLQVEASFANFQELAVWERVNFTAADVASIYNAGAARLTESTSARMTRILDTTSWPAALEAFPAAPVGTVSEIGSGTGVIPELQLVADSEGGELYVTKAGVLTMTARRDVFNATRSAVSQATITDSGVGLRYGTELQIQYDADNLKNDVTVNFSGDGEVNATNTATIAAYGAASTIVETQLDSPTSAADLATLELGVEGVLVPQISPIDISPNIAAADWQTILGLELLDRVTFKRTPSVGNQFSRNALINAIDHQVEPGVWRTQLTLSMRYTSPLTCDDPVLGRVDYNYCG